MRFSHSVLFVSSMFVVFLAASDLDGQAHDQGGRNGFSASGKSILYPLYVFEHMPKPAMCPYTQVNTFFSVFLC